MAKIYWDIEDKFLNDFEPNLHCPNKKPLEIRIIGENVLRSKKVFVEAGPHDFGRYFANVNRLYILPKFFDRPEYLAHELAHYYYDECKIKLDNLEKEHIKVYRFQHFYKNRRNKWK